MIKTRMCRETIGGASKTDLEILLEHIAVATRSYVAKCNARLDHKSHQKRQLG